MGRDDRPSTAQAWLQQLAVNPWLGFLLSEVGTLLMSAAMLRGGVFPRGTAWVGMVGTAALIVYSATMTFVAISDSMVMAIAAPGGLLMILWYALVTKRLLRLRRVVQS